MYLAGGEETPGRRAAIVGAGSCLANLYALLEQPGAEADDAAMRATASVVTMCWVGSISRPYRLARVLGHTAWRRARKPEAVTIRRLAVFG